MWLYYRVDYLQLDPENVKKLHPYCWLDLVIQMYNNITSKIRTKIGLIEDSILCIIKMIE